MTEHRYPTFRAQLDPETWIFTESEIIEILAAHIESKLGGGTARMPEHGDFHFHNAGNDLKGQLWGLTRIVQPTPEGIRIWAREIAAKGRL